MAKERVLVIGLGEIGRPIFELLKESGKFEVHGVDVDGAKMRQVGQNKVTPPTKVDVMHICIQCSNEEKFVNTIAEYFQRFGPKLTIINSTVPPGTTMAVQENCSKLVAHSPIRGVHKSLEHMKWEIKRWTKYVGGATARASEEARKHFEKVGLKTKVLKSCAETELAKLFETTYRAWMIACFQEMHRISRHFGARFEDVVDFLEDTHRVRLDRPIMFPGVISGHCMIPNAGLLLKNYDSEFLRLLLRSNKKREREIENREIQDESQEVKKRVEALDDEIQKRESGRA